MRGTQPRGPALRPAPVHWLTMPDGRAVGYQIDPELVEDFLLRAGANRADLAVAIKSSKGYVSDILGAVDRVTGEKKAPRRQPSPKVLKQIADFLDVHPRALLLRALPANSVGTLAEPVSGESVSA